MFQTKSQRGVWMLISLIPATVLVVILATLGAPYEGMGGTLIALLVTMLSLYWVCALVAGLTLTIWGAVERSRHTKEAMQYAQRHGWRPISRDMWRNRKRNGVQLAVNKAIGKTTYILTIDIEGDTTMVDEFATPVWALDFGDWLWQELVDARASTDIEVVAQKRAEWEQSRGLALYRGSVR